jgi:hypothetical protein
MQAEGFSITHNHVQTIRKKAADLERVKERHEGTIPWSPLAPAHRNLYAALMLRALSRRLQGFPLARDPEKAVDVEKKLDSWLATRLQTNRVIDYTPERGFFTVPRRKAVSKWGEMVWIDPPWIKDPTVADDGSRIES